MSLEGFTNPPFSNFSIGSDGCVGKSELGGSDCSSPEGSSTFGDIIFAVPNAANPNPAAPSIFPLPPNFNLPISGINFFAITTAILAVHIPSFTANLVMKRPIPVPKANQLPSSKGQ